MFDRRHFLTATAAAAAAGFLPEKSQILKAMPAAESEFGKVKVTDVKTASVMIKYPAHLVKVETDSGLYGIGEAFNRDGVLDHIRHLKETVIGQDPLQVDYLYQRMAELKLGHGSWTGTISSSISGIEMSMMTMSGLSSSVSAMASEPVAARASRAQARYAGSDVAGCGMSSLATRLPTARAA